MTNKRTGMVHFYLQSKNKDEVVETEYTTSGILYKKNNKYFLFFEENNSQTKCRLEFDEQMIRIKRSGQVSTDQVYTKEKIMDGCVKTPYGLLVTKAKTDRYQILKVSQSKLEIELVYDLFIADDQAGRYDLRVEFDFKKET